MSDSNSLPDWQPIDEDDMKSYHISIVIPRARLGCNHVYFQKVCSCGWHGEWRGSKITAQMDQCENKHFGR